MWHTGKVDMKFNVSVRISVGMNHVDLSVDGVLVRGASRWLGARSRGRACMAVGGFTIVIRAWHRACIVRGSIMKPWLVIIIVKPWLVIVIVEPWLGLGLEPPAMAERQNVIPKLTRQRRCGSVPKCWSSSECMSHRQEGSGARDILGWPAIESSIVWQPKKIVGVRQYGFSCLDEVSKCDRAD